MLPRHIVTEQGESFNTAKKVKTNFLEPSWGILKLHSLAPHLGTKTGFTGSSTST
jgi:hypothetical protein